MEKQPAQKSFGISKRLVSLYQTFKSDQATSRAKNKQSVFAHSQASKERRLRITKVQPQYRNPKRHQRS